MSIYPLTPPQSTAEASGRRQRPFALKAIILLLVLQALGSAFIVLGYFLDSGAMREAIGDPSNLLASLPVTVITAAILGPLRLLAAIGLWRYKRWGWMLNMTLLCYSMAYDAVFFFTGDPYYLAMVLNVAIVFYLNQQAVQDLFVAPQEQANA